MSIPAAKRLGVKIAFGTGTRVPKDNGENWSPRPRQAKKFQSAPLRCVPLTPFEIAKRSLRQADAAWVVLARVLSWARDRGKITVNPCEKGGRLYSGSRADKVWTAEQGYAFLDGAALPLRQAYILAVWTGQREGDLLRLPWSSYDGTRIRLKQSKTSRRVLIPVAAPLKEILDAMPRRSPIILTNSNGKPWTEHGFSSSWRKACKRLGIAGVTFNDLRGTFVTRAALAGGY